YY
ncbi:maltose-binding periplasmic domain protein, partial [Vibrio harveyi]